MITDWITVVPWFVLLVVFLGEKLQQIFIIRSLDQALARAQAAELAPLPAPTPVAQPKTQLPMPSAEKPPAPAPAPSGAFAGAPPWFLGACHEIGFHEVGNNGGIGRYIALAHAGSEGDPWCAIFANAMLEQAGIAGTRSASSQSFRTHPDFVQIARPTIGALAVFWRGSRESAGLGHVGFYRGEDSSSVWTLGGNENDMVQIEALPKSSGSFGLIGYWWPKQAPLPSSGPVLMPAGSPIHVQTSPFAEAAAGPARPSAPAGLQTDITATYFGGQQSAYGGPIIDTKPGVALPFHFQGERPKVRVTGRKSGISIDCDIVDVGPWNINDPYWLTGARPQAETGTDARGRHTNGAGIDLTMAAATAVQIDGKGLVDWEFVQSPSQSPNVV